MNVTLTPYELLMASQIGLMRQIAAVKAGRPDRHGYDGDGWSIHINGACGELAVAKALDVHWDGSVNTFKNGGDVSSVQVRTRSRHDYELLIRDDDPDDHPFVLVTGRAPAFVVRGWIIGWKGKQVEWRQTHGGREPAYFVPHEALNPIETLRLNRA